MNSDAVAQAIFDADPKDQGVEARWSHIPELEREHYSRLAQAAIDALDLKEGYDPGRDCLVIQVPRRFCSACPVDLGLTEEWAFEFTEPLSGTRKHHAASESDAKAWASQAASNRDAAALSRWVTSWKRAIEPCEAS